MDNFHSFEKSQIQSQDGKKYKSRGIPIKIKSNPYKGQSPMKDIKWSNKPYKWVSSTSVLQNLKDIKMTIDGEKKVDKVGRQYFK